MNETAFSFGLNNQGQLGLHQDEQNLNIPTIIHEFNENGRQIQSIAASLIHSVILTKSGVIHTCGGNDHNQLGRDNRKKTIFRPVNALESRKLLHISAGNTFTSTISQTSKLFSWGNNTSGELGIGDRENYSRPKPSPKPLNVVQFESGADHTLGLTTSGNVIVFGAGSFGQMGNNQYTSLSMPTPVSLLVHRPVIQICTGTGSNFCMALTIGGNLYTWGQNNFGQLGTGDTKDRYKPCLIKRLRVAKIKSIHAGQYHVLAVASAGTIFSWGKNQDGQCGIGRQEQGMNTTPIVRLPSVVERLQDILMTKNVLNITCGLSHTLLLLENKQVGKKNAEDDLAAFSSTTTTVMSFGLNSSGQLGLGTTENSARPKKITIVPNNSEQNISKLYVPKEIYCGHHHSFIVCDVVVLKSTEESTKEGEEKTETIATTTPSRRSIPSLSYHKVRQLLSSVVTMNGTVGRNSPTFQRLELSIFAAFSSASVLNTSFLHTGNRAQNQNQKNSGLNMLSVRQSYQALVQFGGGVLSTRLGQATYRLVELLRHCPFDQPENLRVFLIVFENPLLLNSKQNHVVLSTFINALLHLPVQQRDVVFIWIANLPSEYFATVVRVVQRFLTFMTKERHVSVNSSDTTPACLILAHLYQINIQHLILPWNSFYNDAMSTMPMETLKRDYRTWLDPSSGSNVHSLCKTCPFLLDPEAKRRLVRVDATDRMSREIGAAVQQLFESRLRQSMSSSSTTAAAAAADINNDIYFHMKIRRSHLVEDAIRRLRDVMTTSPRQMRKPLRVTFIGEDGIDEGGLSKEFCTLLFKQLVLEKEEESKEMKEQQMKETKETKKTEDMKNNETKTSTPLSSSTPSLSPPSPPLETVHTFQIHDVAVYSADNGQEIVEITQLHPGLPAPTEFYTTKILDSYDVTRVGMEPQLSSSSKRLRRLDNTVVDEIARQRVDQRNGTHTRSIYSLFQQDVDSKLSWFSPSPMCKNSDGFIVRYPIDVLEYETIGIVMGLAMYNGILLEPCFPLALYRLWLSPHTLNGISNTASASSTSTTTPPTIIDVLPLHPTIANSLKQLLEYKGNLEQDLNCTYDLTRDVPFIETNTSITSTTSITSIPYTETLGSSSSTEDIPVTSTNVKQYVSDYIQFIMIDDCWSRADAMRRGFLRVVGCPALSLCSPDELELMLCGSSDVGDFNELKRITKYLGGFDDGTFVVKWFWEIVLNYPETMKRKLLLFVTGSDRVPIKGLGSLPFCIQKSGDDSQRLPTAHSCFNILDLPKYKTKEILRERLKVALRHTVGFGLV